MSNLGDKLDSIRELKDQYGVSTKDAYRYLQVKGEYEALTKEVIKETKRRKIEYRPTQREVSNVCSEIRFVIHSFIASLTEEPIDARSFSRKIDFPQEFRDDKRLLVVPYKEMVVKYCEFAAKNKDKDKAFRSTVKYAITENDFFDESGVRFYSPRLEAIKDLPPTDKFLERNASIKEEGILLPGLFARSRPDNIYGDFLRWIKTGQSIEYEEFNPEDLTLEEKTYLYQFYSEGKTPYDRGLNERTLNRMETQRKVALQYIVAQGINVSQAPEKIEESIQLVNRLARRCGPDEDRLKELRYISFAIKNNKKWLEQVIENR